MDNQEESTSSSLAQPAYDSNGGDQQQGKFIQSAASYWENAFQNQSYRIHLSQQQHQKDAENEKDTTERHDTSTGSVGSGDIENSNAGLVNVNDNEPVELDLATATTRIAIADDNEISTSPRKDQHQIEDELSSKNIALSLSQPNERATLSNNHYEDDNISRKPYKNCKSPKLLEGGKEEVNFNDAEMRRVKHAIMERQQYTQKNAAVLSDDEGTTSNEASSEDPSTSNQKAQQHNMPRNQETNNEITTNLIPGAFGIFGIGSRLNDLRLNSHSYSFRRGSSNKTLLLEATLVEDAPVVPLEQLSTCEEPTNTGGGERNLNANSRYGGNAQNDHEVITIAKVVSPVRQRLLRYMLLILVSTVIVTSIVLLVLSPAQNNRTNRNVDSGSTGMIATTKIPSRPGDSNVSLNNNGSSYDELKSEKQMISTLQAIRDRGHIRCRVADYDYNKGQGFSIELCRALSAAIFDGDADRIDISNHVPFPQLLPAVANGTIDVSTAQVTYTMVRDVYGDTATSGDGTGTGGLSFSTPFRYSGAVFAGVRNYVQCSERGNTLDAMCRDLKVCVAEGSTIAQVVTNHLDEGVIEKVLDFESVLFAFVMGQCNVIASSLPLSEKFLRDLGYAGDYVIGTKYFSKEPLAMVTRSGSDANEKEHAQETQFADLVNWVLRALFAAEAMNITQQQAYERFPTTAVFQDANMNISIKVFQHAIAAVGHYGELCERTLDKLFERQTINKCNKGDDSAMNITMNSNNTINSMTSTNGGLLYGPPMGSLDMSGIIHNQQLVARTSTANPMIKAIEGRNVLRCAIFGNKDETVNAKIHSTTKEYAPLWQYRRFEGPGFASFNVTTQKWEGLDVDFCRAVAAALFSGDADRIAVIPVESAAAGFTALAAGRVDIFAGAPYSLENDLHEPATGMGFAFSPVYHFSNRQLFYKSDEEHEQKVFGFVRSRGLAVLEKSGNDTGGATFFADFIRWVVYAVMYASEYGIADTDAIRMPKVHLFGQQYLRMFRLVVHELGNYDQIYQRNFGSSSSTMTNDHTNPNQLNNGTTTPLINPYLASFLS